MRCRVARAGAQREIAELPSAVGRRGSCRCRPSPRGRRPARCGYSPSPRRAASRWQPRRPAPAARRRYLHGSRWRCRCPGVIPRAEQLRPCAAFVSLDFRRARQPLALAQTAVERFAQVAAVVDQRRGDIGVDLPAQLPGGVPRLARAAAGQNAFIHRMACAEGLRRPGHAALVAGCRHALKAAVVAADVEQHAVRPVAQLGAEEQVLRRR